MTSEPFSDSSPNADDPLSPIRSNFVDRLSTDRNRKPPPVIDTRISQELLSSCARTREDSPHQLGVEVPIRLITQKAVPILILGMGSLHLGVAELQSILSRINH